RNHGLASDEALLDGIVGNVDADQVSCLDRQVRGERVHAGTRQVLCIYARPEEVPTRGPQDADGEVTGSAGRYAPLDDRAVHRRGNVRSWLAKGDIDEGAP